VARNNCLVIGSKGFIGSAIKTRLESLEYNVLDLDMREDLEKPEFYDVEYTSSIVRFLDANIDYIFHFGSPCSVLQFNENPNKMVQNTILGFQNVLKLARLSKAKLIYPSSGNIYGELPTPHSEIAVVKPNNLYGTCKNICEHMAQNENKVVSCGLRIFTGYGPGEEKKGKLASVVYHFLNDMMNDKKPVIWGDGSQERDCVYIDDVVDAAVKAMKTKYSSVCNVGTGITYTYNDIIGEINSVLNKNIEPIYIKKPKNYVDRAVADVTWMRHFLGIRPICLYRGLQKFKEYLETNEN